MDLKGYYHQSAYQYGHIGENGQRRYSFRHLVSCPGARGLKGLFVSHSFRHPFSHTPSNEMSLGNSALRSQRSALGGGADGTFEQSLFRSIPAPASLAAIGPRQCPSEMARQKGTGGGERKSLLKEGVKLSRTRISSISRGRAKKGVRIKA